MAGNIQEYLTRLVCGQDAVGGHVPGAAMAPSLVMAFRMDAPAVLRHD
jgi:hypothetical protein